MEIMEIGESVVVHTNVACAPYGSGVVELSENYAVVGVFMTPDQAETPAAVASAIVVIDPPESGASMVFGDEEADPPEPWLTVEGGALLVGGAAPMFFRSVGGGATKVQLGINPAYECQLVVTGFRA